MYQDEWCLEIPQVMALNIFPNAENWRVGNWQLYKAQYICKNEQL